MLALHGARTAQQEHRKEGGTPSYQRHRPEQTLLHQLIEQHYPQLLATLAEQEQPLPKYVREEFETYMKCGRLEYGFLRLRCEACHAEKLVAFSCKRRGFCPSCGAKRMVESAALLVDRVPPFAIAQDSGDQFLDFLLINVGRESYAARARTFGSTCNQVVRRATRRS